MSGQGQGPPTATTSGKVIDPETVTVGAPPVPPGWHLVRGVLTPGPAPPPPE